jgi:hypothetical protein
LALCLCGYSEKISYEINRARIHEKQDAKRKQQDENRTSGRGADIIILDDPIKADDAQSDTRRRSVNERYDNTIRSRLNNQETGAIIIVMQRLHADDLVAHFQETEGWEILALPAIAEHDETYQMATPYGPKQGGTESG